jgi:dTDP-glucose 4,6-dehydratase
MRIVVTGGAGFLGSHLTDRLIELGHEVIVIDNLITGRTDNVAHLFGHERFSFIKQDVTEYLYVKGSVDAVMHLASPASPKDFSQLPIQILKVGSLGTHKALGLAKAKQARFLLASTSEVYGDPELHPQPESYWGRVNPVGPRGVYDESKRFAEALTMAYHVSHGIQTRIGRIFNTYGPRMRLDDGRVLPNLMRQALLGEELTVYGDGSQTRSFCYVADQVEALIALLLVDDPTAHLPVNLGTTSEVSIRQFAEEIVELAGTAAKISFRPLPQDDPKVRCPDVTRLTQLLGWKPQVGRREGLLRTLTYFREELAQQGELGNTR